MSPPPLSICNTYTHTHVYIYLFWQRFWQKARASFDIGVEAAEFLWTPAGDNSQSLATGAIFFGGGVTSRTLRGRRPRSWLSPRSGLTQALRGKSRLPAVFEPHGSIDSAVRQRRQEADDPVRFVRKLSVSNNQLMSHAGRETDQRWRGRKQEVETFWFPTHLRKQPVQNELYIIQGTRDRLSVHLLLIYPPLRASVILVLIPVMVKAKVLVSSFHPSIPQSVFYYHL